MTARIQLKRVKDWKLPVNARLVSRPSRWGNPFRVNDGSVIGRPWFTLKERRIDAGVSSYWFDEVLYSSHSSHADAIVHAVELFRMHCSVLRRDRPEDYLAWLAPIRCRDLACWCSIDKPCHADVLLELANQESQ